MKLFTFILCALFLNSQIGNGQAFLKRIPKLQYPVRPAVFSIAPHATSAMQTDSLFSAFRPIVVAAAFMEPGNIGMAGAGVAYQKLDYNYGSQLYTVKWEIAAVGFAGGSVVPKTVSSIATFSIMAGAPIGGIPLLIGPAFNPGAPTGQKWGVALSASVNFNN